MGWGAVVVVTDIKDTSFWKQFTTVGRFGIGHRRLLLISKIPHFESNSQRNLCNCIGGFCCYWYQRYLILKAIHNTGKWRLRLHRVVTDIKDTSFWKQFTTIRHNALQSALLLLISKIPHFESNSQRDATHVTVLSVVTDIKDTSFWKQFTTVNKGCWICRMLLLISKIPHFESNSQRCVQLE